MNHRVFIRLAPALVAIAAMVPAALAAGGSQLETPPLLPDLRQEPPSGLIITSSGHGWNLGFNSAATNVGAGPLIITGHRQSHAEQTMAADQTIMHEGGGRSVVKDAGRLRYVKSIDHQHWHLLRFERYTLRRVGAKRAAVRDRKTGFCLGDRYRTRVALAGPSPAMPAFTSNCGPRRPGRLSVSEGISVGYGDDYAANLEGQYLKLSGLPDGRYVLAHEVNANRRLRESSYDNNAASVLLALRWRGSKPDVRVLASCEHAAACTPPGMRARSAAAPSAVPARTRRLFCRLGAARRTSRALRAG